MDFTDQPLEIRSGEKIDTNKIAPFLKDTIPGLEGDIVIKQYPSGNSNLTYWARIGNQELILRRPPFGTKAKSAHDMGREYRILKALNDIFPYAPKPLAYTEDESIIGCPFYAMERIKGIILRKDIPEDLKLTADDMHTLCQNYVSVWQTLHTVDYEKAGLSEIGKPEGYVHRQVTGWIQRYRNARTPDAPDFENVMQWLDENMPDDSPNPCLIHNDFKLDNIVLDPQKPTRIIGLLDWEMATIGDPLMDLGSGLAYWVQHGDPEHLILARQHPTMVPGAMTRNQLVDDYLKKSGRKIDSFTYYYCFGLFRLAVIAQQIYYRFYHNQTKDKRFEVYILGVKIFEEAALKLIS